MRKYVKYDPSPDFTADEYSEYLRKLTGKHGYFENVDEILYDYIDDYNEDELELFGELGFLSSKYPEIWFPEKTKFYFEGVLERRSENHVFLKVNDSELIVNWSVRLFHEDLSDGDFKVVHED